MRIRVLGCHGGELRGCRSTCFLVDERTALDAGALTATLDLPQLASLEDIFLTHAHFDHMRDIPLLCDAIADAPAAPLRVRGTRGCLGTLARSVFNDELWPDFTRIPSPDRPVVSLCPHSEGESVRSGACEFVAVPVRHPVEAVGYVVRSDGAAVAFSGDTGPTDGFWDAARAEPSLRAVFVELSFPDRLRWLADVAGHLTPALLARELQKLRRDVPVLLYHLKPAHLDELRTEVAALGDPRVRILSLDEELVF